MKIFNNFKKFALGLLSALVLVLPAAALAENTPRFNQLNGDLEFLTGKNITAGQTDYSDPVSAKANETVRVRVYYHNNAVTDAGDNGQAATNTKIKINLPTTDATSHLVTGTLSADNASSVAGTFVNGQEVGQPGLTINTDQVTSLKMVSGSVKWYPNGSSTPVSLPDGQNGDNIISNDGINIGNITGCWQYAGFVTLDVVLKAGNPDIVNSKSAYNLTQDVDATLVKAKAGDKIRYTLTTTNKGQGAATNYVVVDDIHDILEYANFLSASDAGQLSGVTVVYPAVDIAAGQTITRTFEVQVKPLSQWPASGNLIMSNIYGNRVDVPLNPPDKSPILTIEKHVKNVTQSFDWRDEVSAHRNDVVAYRIRVRNVGDAIAKNVNIKDVLPSGINFRVGSVQLERKGQLVAINDSVVSGNGYTLDTPLEIGEQIVIYYQATVGSDTNDGDSLKNVVTAVATDTDSVTADAVVKVEVPSEEVVVTTPEVTPTTPAPVLPITGPADIAFALFALGTSGATSYRYLLAKRSLSLAASDLTVL